MAIHVKRFGVNSVGVRLPLNLISNVGWCFWNLLLVPKVWGCWLLVCNLGLFESIQKWVQIYIFFFYLYICFKYTHIMYVWLCQRLFNRQDGILWVEGSYPRRYWKVCGKQFGPPKIGKTESYHREWWLGIPMPSLLMAVDNLWSLGSARDARH